MQRDTSQMFVVFLQFETFGCIATTLFVQQHTHTQTYGEGEREKRNPNAKHQMCVRSFNQEFTFTAREKLVQRNIVYALSLSLSLSLSRHGIAPPSVVSTRRRGSGISLAFCLLSVSCYSSLVPYLLCGVPARCRSFFFCLRAFERDNESDIFFLFRTRHQQRSPWCCCWSRLFIVPFPSLMVHECVCMCYPRNSRQVSFPSIDSVVFVRIESSSSISSISSVCCPCRASRHGRHLFLSYPLSSSPPLSLSLSLALALVLESLRKP